MFRLESNMTFHLVIQARLRWIAALIYWLTR